jgi:hypothetical protein
MFVTWNNITIQEACQEFLQKLFKTSWNVFPSTRRSFLRVLCCDDGILLKLEVICQASQNPLNKGLRVFKTTINPLFKGLQEIYRN